MARNLTIWHIKATPMLKVSLFLCTRCVVCRGDMDVKERRWEIPNAVGNTPAALYAKIQEAFYCTLIK